jgi:hypothetical protein
MRTEDQNVEVRSMGAVPATMRAVVLDAPGPGL